MELRFLFWAGLTQEAVRERWTMITYYLFGCSIKNIYVYGALAHIYIYICTTCRLFYLSIFILWMTNYV